MFKVTLDKNRTMMAIDIAANCAHKMHDLRNSITEANKKYVGWGEKGEQARKDEVAKALQGLKDTPTQAAQALDVLKAEILQNMADQIAFHADQYNPNDAALLNAGIFERPSELDGMIKTYAHNPTMLRAIQQYARARNWEECVLDLNTTENDARGLLDELFKTLEGCLDNATTADYIKSNSSYLDRMAEKYHFKSFEEAMTPGWIPRAEYIRPKPVMMSFNMSVDSMLAGTSRGVGGWVQRANFGETPAEVEPEADADGETVSEIDDETGDEVTPE